ncbi:uncharacterized protein [Parasteatoda tepidariorum]|uniref:uncharacterized protein n=1 Tax=Parasteatoda tepidariorum TaxID=114398 RepID=UPI0039BCDEDE
MKKRTDNLTMQLKRTAKALYGKQPDLLKRIYAGSIERIALYGIGAWGSRLDRKGVRDLMGRIQRNFLIGMTKAYCTVATATAQTLGGVLPLDLKAKNEYDLPFDVDEYEAPIDIWAYHPAQRPSVPYDSERPKGKGLEIFTDGSGMDDKKGAGVVILDNTNIKEAIIERLANENSVFQSEMVAILRALQWLFQNGAKRSHIYSDSLSSLQALNDVNNKSKLVNKVKREYLKLTNNSQKVRFHYVRAHIGIVGNELADYAAKLALKLPQCTLQTAPTKRKRYRGMAEKVE